MTRSEKSLPMSLAVRLLLAFGLIALSISVAAPAQAHASLVESSPHQGDSLDRVPTAVWFEFSETMLEPAYVVVTDPDGESATTGEVSVEDNVVSQDLTGGPDGNYVMAYRAVSADGHPVSGEITFSVGDGEQGTDGTATETPAPAGDEPDPVGSEATGEKGKQATSGGGPGRGVVVAIALFGGAGVLLLLSRRRPT